MIAALQGKSRIRKSTDADLRAIHAWLKKQNVRDVPGTFFCNWESTRESHKKGKLLVYIDGPSGEPVAYQWGGLVHAGILEVRYDMRGKGIGRKLVERRIKQAIKHDQCFLYIKCKPSSSIPFWQRMGFILFTSESGKNYAYRVLEKKHRLPSDGVRVDVTIRFFLENPKRSEKASAYSVATPNAVKTSDGVVHLAERVLFFRKLHPDSCDPFIEVEVAGKILMCDKAKYPEAKAIGVQRCHHGFYLDCVLPTPLLPR